MQSQSPVSAIQLKTSQCICKCHLIRPVATLFDFIKNAEMTNNLILLYSWHNLFKDKTKQTTIILHQQFLKALPFSFSLQRNKLQKWNNSIPAIIS
jgi:hypothetical protein